MNEEMNQSPMAAPNPDPASAYKSQSAAMGQNLSSMASSAFSSTAPSASLGGLQLNSGLGAPAQKQSAQATNNISALTRQKEELLGVARQSARQRLNGFTRQNGTGQPGGMLSSPAQAQQQTQQSTLPTIGSGMVAAASAPRTVSPTAQQYKISAAVPSRNGRPAKGAIFSDGSNDYNLGDVDLYDESAVKSAVDNAKSWGEMLDDDEW